MRDRYKNSIIAVILLVGLLFFVSFYSYFAFGERTGDIEFENYFCYLIGEYTMKGDMVLELKKVYEVEL